MVRAHIIFSGHVQGVGFRFTTQRFASSLSITGWVKNLSDGKVELICEGSREQLENLIYKIDRQFAANITHRDIDWLPAKKSFRGFDITY